MRGLSHQPSWQRSLRGYAARWCCLLVVSSVPQVAFAAPEAEPLTLKRTSPRTWSVDHRPTAGLALQLGRELHWARMTLVEDLPFLRPGQTLAPVLPLSPGALDPHLLLARPHALGSMASAVGQLVLRASSCELWKRGRLRQRHHFRPFVGMTGVRLTWRIDF
jgi:hypothetical protein